MASIAQDGIERNDAEVRQPRDGAAQPQRQARNRVVHAHDHDAARSREARDAGECRGGIGRVMHHAGTVDGVQRALRRRVVPDEIPQIVIPLDPDWRLPWDRHPNARAARAIADAIAASLGRR